MQNQDHLNQENSGLVNRVPESQPMAARQESPGNPENKEVDSPDSPRGSSVVPTPMKPRKKPGLKLVLAILIPALVLMIAASGLLIFFHAPMNPEKAYQKTTAAFLADYQEYVSQMNSLMKDPATGKTDTKVNTVLNLSAESTGLASDLKVDASVTRSGEDFLLNVRVYTDLKEAFLTCGKAEDTLGFSLSVPLVEKDWLKKSMAGYVQIKGLAESFRNSPFNPANNPDSGLTQEQFDALLQLCQTLERELDTAIPDAQEEQEPMLLPDLLVDFYQAFMKKASIKSYSTFPSGSSFGLFHPERHIEVSLDEEAFSSVPGIIRDLLKEPKYEFVLDELNAILKEVQVDELNADDVNSFLDEMQKVLDEAHLTFTGSIVSLDGKITSAKLSTEFSTSSDPDHPENARVDLSIRVEYGNGRKDASVKNAGLSIELYEDDQLEARTGLDYTCEKTAEGTLAGELKFSLAEWSDDDPPVKKDLYHAEMQFGDEKFSLSLGDNFEVKGSYAFSNLDDGTPSFQLKLNELTKTQLIPKYIIGSGIQYVKEETCFTDFLTVTVQRASGVMLPKKALNRNLLDSEDDPVTYLRQNAGDCWKAAREYVAFALTPNPSEVPVLTEEGYQIQDVQQIGEEYMNILQKYNQTVNEYVQWYAIPEDPVFTTCLFQSDVSGLWYYLYVDWTKSESFGLLYADPPEELIQMIHPAKIVSGKMVIHEWQMQDEVIHSCSEPDYKLGTCSFCDCQLKRYVSGEPSLQHVFSPDAIGYEFDPDTGTEETAVYRTCTQCGGRCEVEFKSYIFEMVVSDNQATVVSGQEMNPGTDPLDYPHCMVIPQFADKDHRIPVTTIEGPVHLNSSILFIPDGVKVLKEGAFDSYTSYVRAVFLPKSIERIEESYALRNSDITLFFEGNEEEWFSIQDEVGYREAQFGWPGFPFEDLYENEGVFLARNQALYDAYNILNTPSSSAMQLQVGSSIQVYGKNKIITAAEYDAVTDRIALLVEHEIVILNPQDGSVIQTIQTQAKSISADSGYLAVGESYYSDGVTIYDMETLDVFKEIRMPEKSGIQSILEVALDGDQLIVLGQITRTSFGICIYDIKTDQCRGFTDCYNRMALDRNSHTVWALSTVLDWLEWVSFDSRTGNELANWGDGNFEDFNMSANNFWFDGLNLTASTFVSVSSRDYQNLQVYKKFRIELPEGITKLSEGSFIDGIPDGYKVISVISGGSNGGIEAAVLQNKETNAVSTLIRYDERTVMINVFADRAVRCGDRILLFTKDTRFVFLLDPQSF